VADASDSGSFTNMANVFEDFRRSEDKSLEFLFGTKRSLDQPSGGFF
jgi:hypothetical protein